MDDSGVHRLRGRLRAAVAAWLRLGAGLPTSMLALVAMMASTVVGVASMMSVGLPALPYALKLVRALADRERAHLSRTGPPVPSPYRLLPGGWGASMRVAVTDPATRRDLGWIVARAAFLFAAMIGLALPLSAIRDVTLPLWWWLVPAGDAGSSFGFPVTSWSGAFAAAAASPVWLVLSVVVLPHLARFSDHMGRRLLSPRSDVDLSARITELTATRAAALDAHTAELRRIERALHDGAQNRLVGVTVLTGAARRALTRDPAAADAMLERAQTGAEEALAELRSVIRGILPPILDQRGLDGALAALAAGCAVPCALDVDVAGRCPTSVEATAYFVVAEALTNISKHSGARRASVGVKRAGDLLRITITDDGKGGADEQRGSGLSGLKGRVAAHDGTARVSSPVGGPTIIDVELPCGS
ncbi:sensor histidine kinase [Phytomonospora endophytica]|uniref:histidine kinase n=1 Tax=Phytomonospora endophytica TaxID=714109 RepID=A0A841F8Q6_9ACTN|nr:sensor histidine kinase [Phytomonospora endophytica]MBB6032616.1 signal transduction histidine kinase [Phytomonospora endophytica]